MDDAYAILGTPPDLRAYAERLRAEIARAKALGHDARHLYFSRELARIERKINAGKWLQEDS